MLLKNTKPGLPLAGLILVLLLSGCGGSQGAGSSSDKPAGYKAPGTPPSPPVAAKPVSLNRGLKQLTAKTLASRSTVVLSLTAGWNTLSFPLQSVTATSGFGYCLYKFNGSGYDEIDPINHPEAIDCRIGYWTYAEAAAQVSVSGTANQTIASIPLIYGWNLVSVPFAAAKSFGAVTLTHSTQKSLTAAASLDIPPGDGTWIYGRLYNYRNGAWEQQEASGSGNLLRSTYGYWVWCWNTGGTTTLDFTDIGYIEGYFYQTPRSLTKSFKLNQRSVSLQSNARTVLTAPPGSSPVSGATIYVEGLNRSVQTDANGYFRITFMESGTYYLYALENGFTVVQQVCTVPQGGGIFAGYLTSEPATLPQIAYFEPASARAGAPLKIRGTNFGSSGQVSFNGIPAQEYGKWSSTEIWLQIPASAASGPVVVSTGGSSSGSQNLSIAPRRDLTLSYAYAPAGAQDVVLAVDLTRGDLDGLNGIALKLNYDPAQLSLKTGTGKNGMEAGSLMSSALLLSQVSAGKLQAGLTLPGTSVSGSGEVALVHFAVNSGLTPGTLCPVTLEGCKLSRISAGSYSFITGLSLGAGGIVIKE